MEGDDVWSMLRRVNAATAKTGGYYPKKERQRGGNLSDSARHMFNATMNTAKIMPYLPPKYYPQVHKGLLNVEKAKTAARPVAEMVNRNPKTTLAALGTLATATAAAGIYRGVKNRRQNKMQKGGSLKTKALHLAINNLSPTQLAKAGKTYLRARRLKQTMNNHFIDGIDKIGGHRGLQFHTKARNAVTAHPKRTLGILGAAAAVPAALAGINYARKKMRKQKGGTLMMSRREGKYPKHCYGYRD